MTPDARSLLASLTDEEAEAVVGLARAGLWLHDERWEAPPGSDVDGGAAQDALEAFGVIEAIPNDDEDAQDHYGEDIAVGAIIYRETAGVPAARSAIAKLRKETP